MSMEDDFLEQFAVLWSFASYGNDGLELVSSPVQLKVRWEERTQEFNDSFRGPILSDVVAVFNQDIPVLSILRLGKIQDLASGTDNLYQIRQFNKTPSLMGESYRRVGMLIRYGDTLPTVV